jgi:tellurite resistance protein
MGLAGLTLAWQKAHAVLGAPLIISAGLRGVVSALFIVLLIIYGLKALRYPQAIGMEARHPIRINFFPTVSISLLLLAIAYLETAPQAAFWLWVAGAILHLGFTLAIFGSWIHHTHYDIKHANPAWFIPVVGNIIIPVAGVRLASPELSWFFFSIGLVFWMVLLTIVLYRLFFHEPLPVRLAPTLFILLAPPSVGFIAYIGLTGELDAFARILYYTALFLALLLASNALRFLRLPFFISAWAYSFPLAALTLATLIMGARLPGSVFALIGIGLLALLSLVVAVLVFRTMVAIQRREICVPE